MNTVLVGMPQIVCDDESHSIQVIFSVIFSFGNMNSFLENGFKFFISHIWSSDDLWCLTSKARRTESQQNYIFKCRFHRMIFRIGRWGRDVHNTNEVSNAAAILPWLLQSFSFNNVINTCVAKFLTKKSCWYEFISIWFWYLHIWDVLSIFVFILFSFFTVSFLPLFSLYALCSCVLSICQMIFESILSRLHSIN